MPIKSSGQLARLEFEIELASAQFELLWPATKARRIEKTRYELSYCGHTIEVDVYHGQLAGLITAEVEFGSTDASEDFSPPDWFGGEVTEGGQYKNRALATQGLPPHSNDSLGLH